MTGVRTRFEIAARDVQSLAERPSDQVLLKLYGLYKQATEGDVEGERPGLSDMVARFKHDAWAKLIGTPRDEAMQAYVDLVDSLKE
ncbi:MAG TPA: acyl-CoA-binding protein [Anaerolineae bacterium]|jgi:diazepam-binding inhibitor (GABA receptor modulating acyl-CoA-binding protein)|nr:acyl-CoA-binding protein [Anaerolineae bacterium]